MDNHEVRAIVWRTLADHQWGNWTCSCGGVDAEAREYEDNHLADMIASALVDD